MKKRLVSLFLALTMTWGLTACAGGSSAPASSAAPASAADPAASADAASAQGEAEGSKTDNTGTDVKASYTLNIGSAMSSTNPSSIGPFDFSSRFPCFFLPPAVRFFSRHPASSFIRPFLLSFAPFLFLPF